MHKRSLAFMSFGKNPAWCKRSLRTFSEKLETALPQTVEGRLNGGPQTPWLSYISNYAFLSRKLLLSPGRKISSKKMASWFVFLMKTLIFHQWFSIHNLGLNTRWVKKEMLSKIIHFDKRLYIFLKQTILGLKTKQILDNKSW